jgi:DNA-binding LacI/PurR family transcriptional regulator
MSSKPTLRDIAEATGVSTASVSMILNGKSLERFSSQRVASVLAEAERIGYRTPSARCSGKQIGLQPLPHQDDHRHRRRGQRRRLPDRDL